MSRALENVTHIHAHTHTRPQAVYIGAKKTMVSLRLFCLYCVS